MGRLDDDLGGLAQGCSSGAPGNDAEGLGLVGGEAAHPLMEHGGHMHIAVAALFHIFVGKLLQRADGRHILRQVAALAIAHGDVLDALLCRQQRFDDGHGVGDAGRHQRAGQGAVGLPVDGDAGLLIHTGEPVHILPVPDGLLHGDIFGVGQVIGDAAALIGGKAAGVGDLGEQTGVGGAVADLHGDIQALDELAAGVDAVVHCGEAIEHGAAVFDGLLDAVLRLRIAVLTGVAVDGGGQQICFALVLQIGQQLDVLIQQRNAGAGLDQGDAVLLGVQQLLGENAVFGHGLVIIHGLLEIYIFAGGPRGQDFLPQRLKLILGNAFILNIHLLVSTPFS